jgi:putative addiction module component (TIGR02574 family)
MSDRKITVADVLTLSADERIRLVEDIWDTLVIAPEAVVLTDEQRRELDSRLEEHRRDPSAGSTWPEVKARILKRL